MDAAAAIAAMHQMQAQMQQQAQLVAQLQQQMLQHQPVQQPPQPLQPPAANRPAAPRIPNPPLYDGRATALDDWLSALRQQFRWYDASMAADADRLRFGTTHLKGSALDWWEQLGATAPVTWADFETALRARFQPVTSAESARSKLLALTQGKSPVNDYITTFRRLVVAVPDMSEADRLFQFTRGLAPPIAMQLRVHGVATIDAAISMAARVGSLVELAPPHARLAVPAAAAASSNDMDLSNVEGLDGETSSAEGSAPVTQAQLQAMLNAMRNERASNRSKESKSGGKDVAGAIGKRFKLTPEQVREHFDKGQCFNCHSTEHSSRNCPKPKKSAN